MQCTCMYSMWKYKHMTSHVMSSKAQYIVHVGGLWYTHVHMLKCQTAPCASRENCSHMPPLFCREK